MDRGFPQPTVVWLFDVTGSYRLAFMPACVAVAGSAVAAWFAARPMARSADAPP